MDGGEVVELVGGGQLITEPIQTSNGPFKVRKYKKPGQNRSNVVSEHMYERLKQTMAVKRCPEPNGDPKATNLVIYRDGTSECKKPDVLAKIRSLHEKLKHSERSVMQTYLKNNDLTDLVAPYMTDPTQKSILSDLLGYENVSDMEMLNTLVHSGIINKSCPPPDNPFATQAVKNVLTGRIECHEPIPLRTPIMDARPHGTCPDDGGDPLAVEEYIDALGTLRCRRPPVGGNYACPTADDPLAIHHITLPNGIGICVRNRDLAGAMKYIPTELVFPEHVNARIADFLRTYNRNRFQQSAYEKLKGYLAQSKSLNDLRAGLSGDPEYEEILAQFTSDDDMEIARLALVEFAKRQFGERITSAEDLASFGLLAATYKTQMLRDRKLARKERAAKLYEKKLDVVPNLADPDQKDQKDQPKDPKVISLDIDTDPTVAMLTGRNFSELGGLSGGGKARRRARRSARRSAGRRKSKSGKRKRSPKRGAKRGAKH